MTVADSAPLFRVLHARDAKDIGEETMLVGNVAPVNGSCGQGEASSLSVAAKLMAANNGSSRLK